MYSYQAPQTQACQPGSRYSTLLIRDDVEDEIRKPNNVVCRDHEMQIILGKSYCTDLLARKNSNHLSHTLTTSQKTFTAQQLDFLQMGCKSSTVFDSLLVLSPTRITILYVSFTTTINEKYVNTLSPTFQKKDVRITSQLYTCLGQLSLLYYIE